MIVIYEYQNLRLGMEIPNLFDPKLVDEFELVNFSMSSVLSPKLGDKVNVFLPKQIHSDDIIVLKENKIYYKSKVFDFDYSLSMTLEADVTISYDKGIFVGVRTADCAPVLFKSKDTFGALHAGWRGLRAGIIQKTIHVVSQEKGFDPKDSVFFILPCIHVCCYEVGSEFLDWAKDFCYLKGDKIYFDIPKFILSTLTNLGVSEDNIFYSPICTSCYSNVLPSFRATKTQERIVSFVSII